MSLVTLECDSCKRHYVNYGMCPWCGLRDATLAANVLCDWITKRYEWWQLPSWRDRWPWLSEQGSMDV